MKEMNRMQIAQGLIKLKDLHDQGKINCEKDDKEDIAKAISASIEIILRAKGNDLFGKDY
jgi:hypothetical protein|tara:strand:- start:774 stop:953 length:180 start_codon:yes stop_codon:yes gene_type:complete